MTVNDPDLILRRDQIIAHISQLQTLEQDLTNQLNVIGLTDSDRTRILGKINEISQLRIDLYRIINEMYSYYQDNFNYKEHSQNIQHLM
jgi:hypothetical protein